MVIHYFRTPILREKIKIQQSSKIIFFHKKLSSEHIEVYIHFNRRKNEHFRIFFSSGLTKISHYEVTPKLRFANQSLQNPDFKAIYLFSVNRYHTSAKEKSVSYQSSFIVLKFQRNRTKPELIIILFVTPLHLIDSTKTQGLPIATRKHDHNISRLFGQKKLELFTDS